jgi:tetratricopeptide (TPR) repeat protein
MPTSRLIRTRAYYRLTPNDQGMFYLQAWQLVHYFMLGPGKNVGSVGTRMARYVRALEQGEREAPAFEAAFGMSLSELDRELLAYGRLDAIPAVAPKRSAFVPEAGHEVRQVPPAQVAVQLGILAQAAGLASLADRYYQRALAADATLAHAHVGAAAVLFFEGDSDAAERELTRALELAPDDYEVQIDFGHYFLLRAQREERLDLVPSARKHLLRGIELAPEVPEGHALLGRTYVLTEEDPQPGIASLERARALLPGNLEIQLPLAQLYLRAGRSDDARAVAQRVARWSHGDVSAQAKQILDELGELEPAAE